MLSRYLVRRMDRPMTLSIAKFQELMLNTILALHTADHAIRPIPVPKRKKKNRKSTP
jgi:LysR family nitrogen assimilation transcriptional regulator